MTLSPTPARVRTVPLRAPPRPAAEVKPPKHDLPLATKPRISAADLTNRVGLGTKRAMQVSQEGSECTDLQNLNLTRLEQWAASWDNVLVGTQPQRKVL